VSTTDLKAAFTEQIEVKPAASVWEGPDPTDLAEQVEFFKTNGFVILRNVLSSDDLKELENELNRMARDYKNLPRIREGFDLEPNQDKTRDTPTFRKIGGITDMSDAFNRLLRHQRILKLGHAIMGPEIHLHRDVVMMKPARVGREKPWHQDSVYWPWKPMRLVSAMTALDDSTPENGCLQVIPGTHIKEVQHFGKELQIDIDDAMQAKTIYAPLKAGDTLLFHSLLLHASEPNKSENDRRVCIFSYKPADLEYIREGEAPEPILVSKRN